jgi:hypothetical protein
MLLTNLLFRVCPHQQESRRDRYYYRVPHLVLFLMQLHQTESPKGGESSGRCNVYGSLVVIRSFASLCSCSQYQYLALTWVW